VRDRYLREDVEFHHALARATHNPMFRLLLDAIEEPMTLSMRASEARRGAERKLREVHRHHEAIYDAVTRGDRAAAEEAMRGHFAEIQDTLDTMETVS
jgi:DNA-binding FadR family transcriptional regulator